MTYNWSLGKRENICRFLLVSKVAFSLGELHIGLGVRGYKIQWQFNSLQNGQPETKYFPGTLFCFFKWRKNIMSPT